MNRLPPRVRIVEVGPRDGLQNEEAILTAETKVAWIERLAAAGLAEIEVGSFVRPDAVPQLADSGQVVRSLSSRRGVVYTALVPNLRGLDRAIECGVRSIAIFTAASETFNRKNTNAGIEESFGRFVPVLARASAIGIRVRGYVSTAFHCPYEGRISPERSADVVARLFSMGCEEVSIGDTIGMATPAEIRPLLDRLGGGVDRSRIAFHFHDTRGTALANVYAALMEGIAVFDSSAGGLGGCPYAPGASGNLATEDLVYLLDGLGIDSGVDLLGVAAATRSIESALGKPIPSRTYQALRARGSPGGGI